MRGDEKKPGDVVTQTSIDEVLRTCGVSLAKWSSDLLYTDAAYAEQYLEQMGEQMAALSYMCHVFLHSNPSVSRDVMIDLPTDIYGFVSVNPLVRSSMDEDASDNTPSTHEGGDNYPF